MLTEDPEGLRHLQSMDLVGVGGAALPPVIGEQLVTKGIKLVSRFGSAECGFLLSSHRTYATDKDWQYLRVPLGSRFISFEDQNDNSGLHELVVLKGWPHMAKTNRPGGSFATHDLFEPHPTIENAWRYHSRSDSQITLVSGKKFDPAPLEDAISSASPLIRDVLIIGNGAQVPGALIFRSSQGQAMENETLVHEIWKVLHSENGKSQSHSQVPRHMMLVLKDTQPLPKSSKGTILRGVAEKQYASEIASLYATEQLPEQSQKLPNNMDDIRTTVKYVVKEVVDADISINDDEDFYRAGVDSMKCARIRSLLQRRLPKNTVLPLNVVYDTGSINALSNYVLCLRDGNTIERTDRGQEMLDLVNRYSNFDEGGDKPRSAQDSNTALYSSGPGGHVVLLTGSTGALGAHILDNLRHHKSVFQILCLVRAKNQSIAHERVSKSLVGRGKPPLDGAEDSRVLCIPADLSKPDFGTSSDLKQVTHIIHAAWAVNFSLPLKSFVQDHIQGLHNLIRLAISSPRGAKVISCSSTASVLGPSHPHLIPERISTDPSDSDALGYSQSKWVAEAICARAARLPGMTGRIKVLRIGQLTGDTEKGIWNMSEAWPLMLSTVGVLGCLPRLDEPLSWLPLDVAAKGLLDIAFCQETGAVDVQDECPVYHVLNNDASATWNDLLQWVARAREKPFGIVEPAVWLDRLEQVDSHPAKGLLNLWRSAYTSEKSTAPRDKKESTCFTTDGAARVSPSLKEIPAIDEGFIRKVWGWLEKETKNG
jgi:thioester reductase-like protein